MDQHLWDDRQMTNSSVTRINGIPCAGVRAEKKSYGIISGFSPAEDCSLNSLLIMYTTAIPTDE
jgi:hypothetical protein